jgi:hypothetical protein
MDASHILVGGLTAITIAFLVWIEIRSRSNTAVQEQTTIPPEVSQVPTVPKKKRR